MSETCSPSESFGCMPDVLDRGDRQRIGRQASNIIQDILVRSVHEVVHVLRVTLLLGLTVMLEEAVLAWLDRNSGTFPYSIPHVHLAISDGLRVRCDCPIAANLTVCPCLDAGQPK